jgi:solute carrier family 25 carnitine/acylcarnitine transporter 20/29
MSADFWAGYVSGAAGILIGNPLDLVKTRLQAGKTALTTDATASTAAPKNFRQHFDHAGALVKGELPPTYHIFFLLKTSRLIPLP